LPRLAEELSEGRRIRIDVATIDNLISDYSCPNRGDFHSMERLDFVEVANLINKSEITNIFLDPIVKYPDKWALYNGINRTPVKDYPINILYIYADAYIKDIESAIEAIDNPSETFIIFSPYLYKSKSVFNFLENN